VLPRLMDAPRAWLAWHTTPHEAFNVQHATWSRVHRPCASSPRVRAHSAGAFAVLGRLCRRQSTVQGLSVWIRIYVASRARARSRWHVVHTHCCRCAGHPWPVARGDLHGARRRGTLKDPTGRPIPSLLRVHTRSILVLCKPLSRCIPCQDNARGSQQGEPHCEQLASVAVK
jgi:hypothetical protein